MIISSGKIAEYFAEQFIEQNKKGEFEEKIYGYTGVENSSGFVFDVLKVVDTYTDTAKKSASKDKVEVRERMLHKSLDEFFNKDDFDDFDDVNDTVDVHSTFLLNIYNLLSVIEISLTDMSDEVVSRAKVDFYLHLLKFGKGINAKIAIGKIEEWRYKNYLKEIKSFFSLKVHAEVNIRVEERLHDKELRVNGLEEKLDQIERKSTILNDKENLGKLAESFDSFKKELNDKLKSVKRFKLLIQLLTLVCPLVSAGLVYLILFDQSVLIELRYYVAMLFPFTALTIIFIYFFRLMQSEENKLKSMIWGLDNKVSIINYYSAMKIVNDGDVIDPELDKAIQMAIIRPVEHVSIENINVYDGLSSVLEPISKITGRNKAGN